MLINNNSALYIINLFIITNVNGIQTKNSMPAMNNRLINGTKSLCTNPVSYLVPVTMKDADGYRHNKNPRVLMNQRIN